MVYTCVPWSPLELTHKIRFNGCFVVEKMPIAVMVNSLFSVAQESVIYTTKITNPRTILDNLGQFLQCTDHRQLGKVQ